MLDTHSIGCPGEMRIASRLRPATLLAGLEHCGQQCDCYKASGQEAVLDQYSITGPGAMRIAWRLPIRGLLRPRAPVAWIDLLAQKVCSWRYTIYTGLTLLAAQPAP